MAGYDYHFEEGMDPERTRERPLYCTDQLVPWADTHQFKGTGSTLREQVYQLVGTVQGPPPAWTIGPIWDVM